MPVARPAFVRILATAAVLLLGASACSDDGDDTATADESSSASGSEAVAPEELRASDAEVAAGLDELVQITSDIAASVETDDGAAADLVEQIEEVWQPIEGTILENDEETYLTFEDNFAVLGNAVEDGDASLAADGSTAIADAADAYLATHPG